jgi:hypothetical protein
MLAYSRAFDGPSNNRVKQTKSALVTGPRPSLLTRSVRRT